MNNIYALFVGGVLPAILWGITAVLQKQSSQASTGPAYYLIAFGLAAVVGGVLLAFVWRPSPWTGRGIGLAASAGTAFTIASGLISFILSTQSTSVSKLAPIWSCNVLVTIAVSLIFLGEAGDFNLLKLSVGTLLIVSGVILVGLA